MKLFMNGGREFSAKVPRPTVVKLKDFLGRSKDGELFTSNQLADKIGINAGTLKRTDIQADSKGYSHLVIRQRYWGKPSTIKQLIKETR
jgi:hypothetical protein